MVLMQNFVASYLDGIHIFPDLAQTDPWDIPRLLAMPDQHVLVMALHPQFVLQGVLGDLAFPEVLGPPFMLIMLGIAYLGHCGICFTHHGVCIPSNLAKLRPRESLRHSIP